MKIKYIEYMFYYTTACYYMPLRIVQILQFLLIKVLMQLWTICLLHMFYFCYILYMPYYTCTLFINFLSEINLALFVILSENL